MSKFNKRLRKLRLEREIMAKTLAELLGITYRNYQRYERGELEPNVDAIISICKFYQISADWLLGISDNPSINNPAGEEPATAEPEDM
jgi:transcriptional regulator with XRE-family HTH domain